MNPTLLSELVLDSPSEPPDRTHRTMSAKPDAPAPNLLGYGTDADADFSQPPATRTRIVINVLGVIVCLGIVLIFGTFAVVALVDLIRTGSRSARETLFYTLGFMLPFVFMGIWGVLEIAHIVRKRK